MNHSQNHYPKEVAPGDDESQKVNERREPSNRRLKNEKNLNASIHNLNASIVLATSKLENLDSDIDLRKDYHDAVDCLIQCESIIDILEEKLASKVQELASKDKLIATLEKRLVQMSLELASTKAKEDLFSIS